MSRKLDFGPVPLVTQTGGEPRIQRTLECTPVCMIAASLSQKVCSPPNGLLPDSFDIRHECLDIFPLKWPITGTKDECSDCGILLEIWRTGGLFQTGVPIPVGSRVEFALTGRTVQGQVTGCVQDEYGFLVHVSVHQNDNWFPQSYCPPYLRCVAEEHLAV